MGEVHLPVNEGSQETRSGRCSSVLVAVLGMPNWLETAAELLRRAGIAHETVLLSGDKSEVVRWLLSGGFRACGVLYCIGSPSLAWRIAPAAKAMGKAIVWHWCGSDVLSLAKMKGWRGWFFRRCVGHWATINFCDSPGLSSELADLGIASQVIRLLPANVEAPLEPLPNKFTVLSYWSDERCSFYGGNMVLQLAAEFPELEFRVVKATGTGTSAPPNVRFLGLKTPDEMRQVYSNATVLIRLPEHDSLSAMVLEMLARGRYVIYNKPLVGCYLATNLQETRNQLERILRHSQPNLEGSQFVHATFSLDNEAGALRDALLRASERNRPRPSMYRTKRACP